MTRSDQGQHEIIDLQARLDALEGWRAHHTALVEELLDGPAPDDPPDGVEIDADQLIAWVHDTITSMIARPLRGELTWCPRWWEHPEAVFRFEALRRAWTELAPEPGSAMSIWIRDHLDPCLRELLHPAGPFVDCGHNDRYRAIAGHTPVPTLPVQLPG